MLKSIESTPGRPGRPPGRPGRPGTPPGRPGTPPGTPGTQPGRPGRITFYWKKEVDSHAFGLKHISGLF